MTEDAHVANGTAEVRTSDGLAAMFPTAEMEAERAARHSEWLARVSQPRPRGHELVWSRSQPLNWHPMTKPVNESTVALVSTGGVHMEEQAPFDVYDEVGDWSYREIPGDVDTGSLTVSHTHYATRDARKDINVMFPLDRLRELSREGAVGSASSMHFGFMGFIPDPTRLVEESVPEVGRTLGQRGVDVVVLTGS